MGNVGTGVSRGLEEVAAAFRAEGAFSGAERYGNGHINDTYLAAFEEGGETRRYVIQRINRSVFKSPPAVMENIQRVLSHLGSKLAVQPDAARRVLTLVPARDGMPYWRDGAGEFWRCYAHVAGGRTYDVAQSPRQAYEAARAFGGFQALLADLPGPRLHDTIPGFHDTPKRLAALEAAAREDALGRAARAAAELDFARERADAARLLQDLVAKGEMPERIVHNDTKLNNVILDAATGDALCVVDLDTVMPGLALHDFGDMARAGATRAAEDERDLSKVEVDLELFESLAKGYLAGVGAMPTAAEREHLPVAGKIIALELGMRFLTDFLLGDAYFKPKRPDHNLERCRAQFKLALSFERKEGALRAILADATRR